MSLKERNRYIQILLKNGVTQDALDWILEDVDKSGIFEDEDGCEDSMDFLLEKAAERHFRGEVISETESGEELIDRKRQRILQLQNEKILEERRLQKEIEIQSELKKRKGECGEVLSSKDRKVGHYGRNKLHEAVSMRNLDLVEKYATEDPKLLFQTDNNGHTPAQMAYYESFNLAYEFLSQMMQSFQAA